MRRRDGARVARGHPSCAARLIRCGVWIVTSPCGCGFYGGRLVQPRRGDYEPMRVRLLHLLQAKAYASQPDAGSMRVALTHGARRGGPAAVLHNDPGSSTVALVTEHTGAVSSRSFAGSSGQCPVPSAQCTMPSEERCSSPLAGPIRRGNISPDYFRSPSRFPAPGRTTSVLIASPSRNALRTRFAMQKSFVA